MKKLLQMVLIFGFLAFYTLANGQNTYDTITFETPTNKIIIDTTAGNLWQIGTAQKEFLNTGHDGPNSIVTDTISAYTVNNNSSFIYVIRNPYTQGCETTLQFWHKYDIDSLDYGEIEASYDGGNSWVPVSDTSGVDPYWSYFWWDMDFHEVAQNYTWHNLRITGTSDGWIMSKFNWQWWMAVDRDTIIANPDSLMIKFSFHSDSDFDNKEGWMIDQIWVAAEYEGCGSAKNYELEENMEIYPNPVTTSTVIHLKKSVKNGSLSLFNSFGQEVMTLSELSGNEIYFSPDNLKSGIYIIRITDNGQFIASHRIVITK